MITLWLACNPGSSVQIEGHDSIPPVVTIPSGTYQIGPSDGITVPHTFQRLVTLTYSFAIQTTEVTYSQWLEVTPDIPDQYCDSDIRRHTMSPAHPVRCVSWCHAVVFANQKSRLDGYVSAYDMTDTFTADVDAIYCNEQAQFVRLNHEANGWRLPTEAEWEIAAATEEDTHAGWYKENAKGHPHPVAQFPANKWGLYDTQGNVFEWIWERFGDYELRTVTDPFHFEVPLVEVYTRPQRRSYLSPKVLAPYSRPNASPSMKHRHRISTCSNHT